MDYAVNTYDLYRDIQQRTGGEIYIGVLGPVRTGKSTFIKRFMDEMVLPYMEDEHARMRAQDELPQSAGGKTITTTEPKFIPNEAAKVRLNDDIEVSVRLIDCVGYMIDGAAGHMEEDAERMVKTPWSEEEIPFTQAAEIGTDKVMRDHSTIGLVITTDGSIGELPRSNYLGAEEKTILALKKSGKPFLVLVNSQKPYSEETRQVAEEIGKKYDVAVMPVNCEQLKKEDINRLLEKILYEFPLTAVEFYFPKWMDMLPVDHAVKQDLLRQIRELMNSYDRIRDVAGHPVELQGDYIQSCKMEPVQLWNGIVPVQVGIDDRYYYEMLSGMLGENVEDEYQLLNKLKELAEMKKEYTKVQDALSMVKIKGYGVVTPDREDIALEKPELIRHGNKFGVKIKASSPSIHMIRANIETEIAPIVGTEQQAQDLIQFIDQAEAEHGIWETNIFGKTVEQLVDDGIQVGIVIGGGNFWRGRTSEHIDRTKADQIGMLATVMNCIYVSEIFRSVGMMTNILTPFECGSFTKLFSKDRANKYFEKGMVVFFAGGTGHPYFSTDTGIVLRAIEMEAEGIYLAKAIDGVYDSDPKINPSAVKYSEVSIQEVIDRKLAVVDLTASIMCMENKMPMFVFGLNEENSIVKAMTGDFNGTKVTV